jgi:hypothetical protein
MRSDSKKPKPSPIDKIRLRNRTAESAEAAEVFEKMTGREGYFARRIARHREAAAHHEDTADKGIHTEYHKQQAKRHRDQASELETKMGKKPSKKDLGPCGAITSATGAF